MLQLSGALTGRQILSLRTGGVVAVASEPIINPANLKIEGWYCQDRFSKEHLILLSQDVREIIKQGFVVNDHEVLTHPEELVRLQKVLKYRFDLLGKAVVSDKKRRLGKVSDYAVEVETFYIQKMYVAQPFFKSITSGTLSVDRSQIVEITSKRIVIRDPLQPVREQTASSSAPAPQPAQ